tara:strand:- start:286 stop:510 length:225 start_codon:yes stop_codon:yes gene_type:complete
MKEVVTYVALIVMEFNDEATCNAFYKNYNSAEGHTPTCAKVISFEGDRDLTYGILDHVTPPPIPRPEAIGEIVP